MEPPPGTFLTARAGKAASTANGRRHGGRHRSSGRREQEAWGDVIGDPLGALYVRAEDIKYEPEAPGGGIAEEQRGDPVADHDTPA